MLNLFFVQFQNPHLNQLVASELSVDSFLTFLLPQLSEKTTTFTHTSGREARARFYHRRDEKKKKNSNRTLTTLKMQNRKISTSMDNFIESFIIADRFIGRFIKFQSSVCLCVTMSIYRFHVPPAICQVIDLEPKKKLSKRKLYG